MSQKDYLKNYIINIIDNNKEKTDFISLYRELLSYNNKIRIYLSFDNYENYLNELYNIIDTYLYSYDSNIINDSINKIYIIIYNM